ncbi:MAG: glycerol acyltransferase [Actinobacteria bacterium]|nr:MAG: glycerol acyltransferase [Actinomycetota bacterium]
MADQEGLAEQAKRNGGESGGEDGALRDRLAAFDGIARAGGSVVRAGQSAAGEFAGGLAARIRRSLTADLDDRDPDYIRESLPLTWLLTTLWFRGEVRNMGNVPEQGPVLLVANHSGGNMTPDTLLFTLAFYTYFGVERAFYQLAHNLVLASPVGQILRRYGTVAASPEHAQRALDAGAALLVYPGGDWEVHLPIWERHKVDFANRQGFVRLALDAGVPIVPVVSIGGQETALFLSHGGRLARALRVDRTLRLKVIPISLALPWGVNVGDLLGHIPLPAKITVEVLAPIDVRAQFGNEPDVGEVYDHVTNLMQETLETLAAERRFPVIG